MVVVKVRLVNSKMADPVGEEGVLLASLIPGKGLASNQQVCSQHVSRYQSPWNAGKGPTKSTWTRLKCHEGAGSLLGGCSRCLEVLAEWQAWQFIIYSFTESFTLPKTNDRQTR